MDPWPTSVRNSYRSARTASSTARSRSPPIGGDPVTVGRGVGRVDAPSGSRAHCGRPPRTERLIPAARDFQAGRGGVLRLVTPSPCVGWAPEIRILRYGQLVLAQPGGAQTVTVHRNKREPKSEHQPGDQAAQPP